MAKSHILMIITYLYVGIPFVLIVNVLGFGGTSLILELAGRIALLGPGKIPSAYLLKFILVAVKVLCNVLPVGRLLHKPGVVNMMLMDGVRLSIYI